MGFEKQTGGDGLFFVVKHHTICRESKHERDGFEPIEVTNPQTNERSLKFIERYKRLVGMVTKIEFRDTGDRYDQRYVDWSIHLVDEEGKHGTLTIPFNSGASSRLMKVAPNLDFSKPVEFRAWCDKSGKVPKTAFLIGQDKKSVPQAYTKDNPGACPKPKAKLGGKWDYSDQTEWLHDQMMNVIIPRVEAMYRYEETENGDEPPLNTGVPNDDDIPF